ncbi:HAMP domain-containing histidine kinase [Embleya sp. NBC_00888]|uniref:sensor histidine kinase n=1 Tax=Embleya sp. NBC_00888 TaxID=2975960 RepID=UPI0038635E52|nr:HAMP domain-containing histidine kinase [Embleya sp. NBC_00888]
MPSAAIKVASTANNSPTRSTGCSIAGEILRQQTTVRRQRLTRAAHPLTVQRTAIEIGLADPHSPQDIVETREQLLALNRRTERLIDGLLGLALGERGNVQASAVALDESTADVLRRTRSAAEQAGVRMDANLAVGVVFGDPLLLRQLVTNLVENAVRHNHAGGFFTVGVSAGSLRVRNTGPIVPADHIPELFELFRRFRPDRPGSSKGSGLGLSIVQAHAAWITTTANHHGGLTIAIALPRAPTPKSPRSQPPLAPESETGTSGLAVDAVAGSTVPDPAQSQREAPRRQGPPAVEEKDSGMLDDHPEPRFREFDTVRLGGSDNAYGALIWLVYNGPDNE